MSNEINKEIIDKLRSSDEFEDNIKDFIEKALLVEYSVIEGQESSSFKKKYLKLIDEHLD